MIGDIQNQLKKTTGSKHSLAGAWNPLGIVALFASLAETCAAVVLVRLPLPIMRIYVWFVMLFPALLILLFFVVLYVKPVVFYPPWAFEDPEILDSFMLMALNSSSAQAPTIKGRKRSRKTLRDDQPQKPTDPIPIPTLRTGKKKSYKVHKTEQLNVHDSENK
jgi:hypothetical protein